MSTYPVFDISRVRLLPLRERVNDLSGDFILPLIPFDGPTHAHMRQAAKAFARARATGRGRLLLCGAHVLRAGVQNYLFDLMEKGFITGIALNGAGIIHDYEIALQGATTESVVRYIRDGRFGMWQETSRLNDIIRQGWEQNKGIGESVGRAIAEGAYPCKRDSLLARAWEMRVPVTVHVAIGQDILHAHPNMDAAATGAASYRDFLIFAKLLEDLGDGIVATFGSAVMAPEVFLKALSMVRNVAAQDGRAIENFTSLVCDVQSLPNQTGLEPNKDDSRYYFRPWKTLLSRTLSDGCCSLYIQERHHRAIPMLWSECMRLQNEGGGHV